MPASAVRLAICLSMLAVSPARGQSMRVSTVDVNLGLPGRPLGEPSLAVDPKRPGRLLGTAMVHDPAAHPSDSARARIRCAAFASADDGHTWQLHVFDIAECFDPWVAITPDGNAVFAALGRDPKLPGQAGDALVVYHSVDGGVTWDPQPVGLGRGHDHPMIVVDGSSPKRASWLYVVSSLDARADSGLVRFGVFVARSRDGGRTFDPPVFLRPTKLMALAETPAVLSDGTLVVSYVEPALGDGRTSLPRRRAWLLQSHDGEFDFSRPVFVNDACGAASGGFSLSAFAVDTTSGPFRDRMYFACNQANPASVVVGTSSDRGESWSLVNDVLGESDSASRGRVMGMVVDANGVLGIAWLESGRNPAVSCADDVYFGASVDAGATFLPPERVASAPSCADRALNGTGWAGDYFGLAVDRLGRFRLLWSGVRDRVYQLHLSTVVVRRRMQSNSDTARFDPPWVTVFRDSAFRIALDTSRVQRIDADSYLVWMQTRWRTPRRGSTRRTPSPFDREAIHTFLRCDPVAYKVARTVVSLGDGPPVDSIGAGVEAARAAGWRTASAGSADAGAGAAACTILRRRAK